MGYLVNIDNGGTLTDICAFDGVTLYHTKTLTTPHDLTECLMAGLAALAELTGHQGDVSRLITSIDHLRYSTTHGTNAIVQRKGPQLGLLTGTAEQASVIRQAAPELFECFVGNREASTGNASDGEIVQLVRRLIADGASRLVICIGGPDGAAEEARLRRLLYDSFPRHLLGAVPLLFSHELAPGADDDRRGWSSIVNAFLHPSMEHFLHYAEERLRRHDIRNPLLVFRNDGGSTRVARTVALHTYSSGPRGGVVGGGVLARHYGWATVVSVDIGGTTTDLALIQHGETVELPEGFVEGAPIAFPTASVTSIAAGGGSILSVVDGEIKVGPESMGALPGPACFGRGGRNATMTDVMAVLGIIDPASYFGGRMVLDFERATRAVQDNLATPLHLSVEDAAQAAIIAYETKIASAIAKVTPDEPPTALMAFGGAGPMNACGIAGQLGIRTILIPRLAGVFSAYGIGFSPIVHEHRLAVSAWTPAASAEATSVLTERADRAMRSEGFAIGDCSLEWSAILAGGRRVELADLLLGDPATVSLKVIRSVTSPALGDLADPASRPARSVGSRSGPSPHLLYRLEELAAGDTASGPCLVEEKFFTAWVRSGWRFTITGNGDLLLEREGS